MTAAAGRILVALALAVVACSPAPDRAPETSPGGSDAQPTSTGGEGTRQGDGYTVCWSSPARGGPDEVSFDDRTADNGLIDPLTGMRGHAAAWGDVDHDGVVDLFFGTFATARPEVYLQRGADGPSPDRVLLGGDGFEVAGSFPEQRGRTSGAAMADLDADGDLDLVLSRNVAGRAGGDATAILANDGSGEFSVVESGIPADLGGRSVGVLDYDHDGLLDLLIVEDHYTGGSSRVFHNDGDLTFADETEASGFPTGVHGLGLATGDLDGDGITDVFVAGSNRLFLGTGGGFSEVVGAVAEWETYGPEDDVAGAAIADVNRDGRLDLVVGHHFNSTVDRDTEVPVRLYLNRTEAPGDVTLEDVTDRAGLVGLPTKAPHVEIADIDNDGWPDIVTSASAGDGTFPAVMLNQGISDDIPTFTVPDGLGSDQYWVTTPTADVDRDGRLDLLAVEWDPALPSILFVNGSDSGHWLEVVVDDVYLGIGARVDLYEAGGAGDPTSLIGSREIAATVGYTAGVESVAHFGLGDLDEVDVVVTSSGGETVEIGTVPADMRISTGSGC